MSRTRIAALVAALALLATACVGAQAAGPSPDEPVTAPVAGMCAADMPDCVDVIVPDDQQIDPDAPAVDEAATIGEARGLLGVAEADLDGTVRVGRRGEEYFALTEDYVIGRMTVELDAADDGTFRVVTVVVELVDGPLVIDAD